MNPYDTGERYQLEDLLLTIISFRTRSTLVALNSAGAREKKKLSAITSFIGEAKKVCGLCK